MQDILSMFQELFRHAPEKSKAKYEEIMNRLLEIERDAYLGRGHYDRSPGLVEDHRNGYKPRRLKTLYGDLELRNPQTRGGFHSKMFDHYQRSEKAILLACAQMYFNGVSTRKVSNLVENVFGLSLSPSSISNYTHEFDTIIHEWRALPIEGSHPYLFVDASYFKVRNEKKMPVSKALYTALGVNERGHYEIVGCMVLGEESEQNWNTFFAYLKGKGLSGVELVISDKHKGLVNSIGMNFLGVPWQRCIFHFKRNFLDVVPKKRRNEFSKWIDLILARSSAQECRQEAAELVEQLEAQGLTKAASFLEDAMDDILTYKSFPENHWRRLRTTNRLERIHQELKRRSKVIRIFPDDDALMRVCGYILMEMDEGFGTSYPVFDMRKEATRM